jgi:DNA-binding NtrC family response regulator
MARKVLIVDDESASRFALRAYLSQRGFEINEAEDCRSARVVARRFCPDAIVLDYRLPDGVASDCIPDLKVIVPDASIIVLTAHASIDAAVVAIKQGAENFITKPVEMAALSLMLERAVTNLSTRKRERARNVAPARDPFIGSSAAIRELREQAGRVAASDRPVLMQGETGSGKGVLAHWIHEVGPRAGEAFVDINCAGLSRELLESELFGHEKGSFTGATTTKQGLLEIADGGTVFLDEIGDMDPALQAKLLKVLEEKQFRRVGDVRDRRVDVRLITATHRDIAAMVRQEKFRADLFFRITTLRLLVPPLRSRVEDIPELAEVFLGNLGREVGRPDVRFTDAAFERLALHVWPGNVRELRNVIERALLLTDEGIIEPRLLNFDDAATGAPRTNAEKLEDVEREHILRIVAAEQGRVERAAQRLGIPRSTLYQKLRKYQREPF